MKRLLLPLALLLVPFLAQAQQRDLATALQHLEANRATYLLTDADLAGALITAHYTDEHGVTHLYLTQRQNGIEVHDGVMSVHLKNDEVVHVAHRFVSKLAARVNTASPSLSVQAAVEAVALRLDLPLTEPLVATASKGGPSQAMTLSTAGISLEPIPAELVYVPQEDGTVRLAWRVEIYELDQQHYWRSLVDAVTGATLVQEDLVVHDDFGFTPVVTDAPNWRADAGVRALLIAKYEAEKAALTSTGKGARTMTNDGQYEVFELPNDSPSHAGDAPLGPSTARTIVTEAGTADPVGSPFGWHDDGTTAYTTTRGNNVWAYIDSVGTEAGPSPDDGLSRNFTTGNTSLLVDYSVNFDQQPGAYSDAAAVNLFYMNNIMHDLFYRYGFTEPSGNMQQTNFNRGGEEADGVLAQGQDGGGTNNANMLTLPDGVPPRMQMYLWSPGLLEELLFIDQPAGLAGAYEAREAAFGRPLDETGVTANLVLAQAGPGHVGAPEEGCSAAASPPAGATPLPYANAAQMAGNIALVQRGSCNFLDKALNAQASGALGLIVYNNTPAEPIAMGATGGEIIAIPVIMIRQADGFAFKAELDNSGTVHGTLKRDGGRRPFRDGDFDNGIIAHEYGHSISSRLVGGPASVCLGGDEQGGEGWSDWAALMLTMQSQHDRNTPRGIGTYSVFQDPVTGSGIRPAPYSTNFAVNDFTYKAIKTAGKPGGVSIPHGVGFVWATAMWEVVWNLVDAYGFDPDLYGGSGGNNLALQLITEGMKYTPCSPTFIDMRDGILAADRALFPLNDPGDPRESVNECRIWEGMARRGIGFSAQIGGIEAFDLPFSCQPRLALEKTVDKPLTIAGDVVTFTLDVENPTLTAATGVVLTDPVPANAALVPGSVTTGAGCNGTVSNGVITYDVGTLGSGASTSCSYSVRIDGSVFTSTLFLDDMEGGPDNWTTDETPPTWVYSAADPVNAHSGTAVWFASDFATDANQHLTLAEAIELPAPVGKRRGGTGTPGFTFWHKYDTELGFDGGFVELSTDGGLSWDNLGALMTENPYNGSFFNGNSCDDPDSDANCYLRSRVDLSDFAGQSVLVRFRMFSDMLVPGVGWWVDDVEFLDQGCIYSTAEVSAVELPIVVSDEGRSCVTNTEPLLLSVEARAFIEGPYDAGSDKMLTTLNGRGDLPTAQPYSDPAFDGTPMDYDGSESVDASFFVNHPTIVDWVLLELRTGTDAASTVARRAVFLTNDGSLVDLDGSSLPAFTTAPGGALYVVVRHRNHLPVMSAGALSPSGSTLSHDFTTGAGQAFGMQPMKQLESGVYGLYGGDADADGQVQNDDKNVNWRNEVGRAGYYSADFDLNGQVQTSDKNVVWRPNTGRGSQID